MIQTGPRVSRIAARIASAGVRTPVSAVSLFALAVDREASTEAATFQSFRCPPIASCRLGQPRPFAAWRFPNAPFASSQSTDYVHRAWKRKSPGPATRRLPPNRHRLLSASIPSPVAASVRSPVKMVCLDLPKGKNIANAPAGPHAVTGERNRLIHRPAISGTSPPANVGTSRSHHSRSETRVASQSQANSNGG